VNAIAGAATDRPSGARVRAGGLRRVFGAQQPVLDGLSLTVEPGEIVAITGRSGSGKTTLLQLLGALDRPDSGEVWLDDVCVSAIRHPVLVRRHEVGFVFQLHHLVPVLSAAGNVELPLIADRVAGAERRRRAREELERVGLAGREDDRPEQLSGGERQRVAIARAIVHRPRLILADEPTGALDRAAADRIADLLVGLSREHGATVIVVSHDPAVDARADRHLQLDGGRLTERAADAAGDWVP